MRRHLALTSFLVPDYDDAISFFTSVMDFELVEDEPREGGKRWVVVRPGPGSSGLLLAQPGNDEQRAMIGRQGGGRVWLFLHTDDFERDIARVRAAGLETEGEPRDEEYGSVVVFKDKWGNRWDLIQPHQP